MKDSHGALVQGRTRWRRFAVVMGAAVVTAGAVLFGMSTGAIATSFAISGDTFKVSADRLEGDGFVQYGGIAQGTDAQHSHPSAVSGIKEAWLFNLCQTVNVPNSFGIPIVLRIDAAKTATTRADAVHATDLLIDMTSLEGNATFNNIHIGQDASTLSGGPSGAVGAAHTFGQQAESVVITNLRQVAYSTSAGTFNLKGLSLKLLVGNDAVGKECF